MQAYSVSEITDRLQRLVAADEELAGGVAVEGEISNFKMHSSGHLYFSLKDSKARMNCVMFAGNVENIDFVPEDGMQVTAYGRVAVYEKTGVCQLYVTVMMQSGVGVLYEKYHRLLKRLEQQGYFAAEQKKPLPLFPRRVAVVTSPTGAVIHDIVTVLKRRNPAVEILLCPSAVQGPGAAEQIAYTVDGINAHQAADVIIVGRGGGSIEELWAFNEPVVAEAIYASAIPVVSAVGHETDFTIADFVADMRAATPSAAAELICVSMEDVVREINTIKNAVQISVYYKMQAMRVRLAQHRQSRALDLAPLVAQQQAQLASYETRMKRSFAATIEKQRLMLKGYELRLKNNEMRAALRKGYAVVYRQGKPVRELQDVHVGDDVRIQFADFAALAAITHLEEEKG